VENITSKYEQTYLEGHINYYFRKVPPDLLLGDCWWECQSSGGRIKNFLSRCHSIMVLHAHINWWVNSMPVGGRSLETYIHPIDTNNNNVLSKCVNLNFAHLSSLDDDDDHYAGGVRLRL
jgi:hypothetical protein